MTTPPFFWLGAEAIPAFVEWQTEEQEAREREFVVIEEGDDG